MFVCCFLGLLSAEFITRIDGSFKFIEKPPSTVYVKKGSDAVFKWEYYVNKKPVDLNFITWKVFNKTLGNDELLVAEYADGRVLLNPNKIAKYDNRVNKTEQATLIIKNVTFEDPAIFTCALTFASGVIEKDVIELVVTGPPSCDPKLQYIKEGDSAAISCNATGVPNQNKTCRRLGQAEKTDNCSLHIIEKITVADRGYYSCEVHINGLFMDNCFVEVLSPLKQDDTSCPMRSYTAGVREQLSLCCPVSGYPPPVVTWEKNGVQLSKGENTMYIITTVKDEHFGNYSCTATDGKSSIGPFDISVTKMAEIPVNFTGGTVAKAAKLEWEHQKNAEFYVVKISGEDIRDDYLVGTQTSLEFYFNALVMKKPGERPRETRICANVTAMNDAGVVGKTPCQYITIKSHQVTLKSNIACFLLVLTGSLVW